MVEVGISTFLKKIDFVYNHTPILCIGAINMADNKIGIGSCEKENVKIEVKDNDKGVTVYFHGKINMQNPGAIFGPYFDELHHKIIDANIDKVVADFTDLQFLNSSGLKSIIRWIMSDASLPKENQYSIKILYNKEIGWQETSLTTFKDLVPELVDDMAVE